MDLHNGDCLEVMKELDDNSVDLLFADLPYQATYLNWDFAIDLDLFWEQANRVCKLEAPMVFTCTTKFGNTLINSNRENFKFDLVWCKSHPTAFLLARKQPLHKHEMIYFFYRKQPSVYDDNLKLYHKHKFSQSNKKNISEYDSSGEIYGNKVYNSCDHSISKNYDGYGKNSDFSIYSPPLPISVLEFKSERGYHPTQKPVALMEWVIKYYSRENDVILDPTMGSGSTGEACRNLNRNFIGIEKEPEIYEIAFNRLIE